MRRKHIYLNPTAFVALLEKNYLQEHCSYHIVTTDERKILSYSAISKLKNTNEWLLMWNNGDEITEAGIQI
jgi:CTP:phosphocholine cytidylyltransferase-like protein